ncbi:MAG: ABC transporter ATP-binding protein [Saprospiraceae bacterium]|nr:ABC transporter ATP-binding protein [Saprospiraceae bacterium]
MKHLSYLNKYFYKYRRRLLAGIAFVFISNYFRVLQPQIIREALDLVVENIRLYKALEGFELQAKLFGILAETLLYFGVAVLILALLMGVFMYFMRQTIIVMSRLVEYDLRKVIFEHYEALHTAFFKKNNTGDLMSRITEDVSKVRMYLGPAILYGINLVSLFIMVIYSMIVVNWELTLYCLAPLPILSISIYYVSQLINKKSEVIQQQLAVLNSTAQETFSGIRVVKAYVQENAMTRFFSGQTEDYKKKSLSLGKINALFFPLMLLLIGASTIITVYIGGLQVAAGAITTGNIAEFVIYVNMLTWPVTAIGWIASIIQQAAASQKRINEFLETQPAITNTVSQPGPLLGHIRFQNVSFVYPDTGVRALDRIDFELQPGQKMAIVGRTGSGKTTIADLLVRLYDATDGKIIVDGRPIAQLDLANLRRRVGYVPQDGFLFSDNVSGNIAFGRPDAGQAEIERYARYAAIHEEIEGLPKGYDTVVGERGVTLSGGQKQRISIARALIKQPDILILDDCLSAVDTTTEKQILAWFNEEMTDKTAIIITHRIYAYLQFDKILVLDEGRIVEEGTHEELLALKGYYFDLFERQAVEETGHPS